jgi:endoribonuclease Dicer
MDMFCGDMGTDLWNRDVWKKHFSENMVIVCTAEVFRQALHYSFVSISQINLLIFDEAHHTKANHPYARIMKDFYHQDSCHELPKVFGMTASPVDSKVGNVTKAAAELEGLLCSQIVTPRDPTLLQYTVSPKQEQMATYAPLGFRFQTRLYQKMHQIFKSNTMLKKPLNFAYEASRELGSWCADQVWVYVLSEDEVKKLEAKIESTFYAKNAVRPLEVKFNKLNRL